MNEELQSLEQIIENSKQTMNELSRVNPSLQAVFILSAGISKRFSTNTVTGEPKVRLTPFAIYDKDSRGFSGWGKIRVVAGASLAKRFSNAEVVTLSRSLDNTSEISEADLYAGELKKHYKIDNKIETNSHSIDTFSELLDLIRISIEKGWSNVAVVTDGMQKTRAEVMLQSLLHLDNPAERAKVERMLAINEGRYPKDLYERRKDDFDYFRESYKILLGNIDKLRVMRINLISGESIIPLISRHYAKIVEVAMLNPIYKRSTQRERTGANDWQRGQYGSSSRWDE